MRAYVHDLKVFFTVVAKEPVDVRPAEVFGFITVQQHRGSGNVVRLDGGVSPATVRRRLAAVSAFYGYLVTRGDTGVETNPVPPWVADSASPRSQPTVGAGGASLAADLGAR